MVRITHIVMYKLKNVKNIIDIVEISYNIGAVPVLILREDFQEVEQIKNKVVIYENIEELLREIGNRKVIVLETYGDKYVHELDLRPGEDVCIMVGSEDLGVPEDEVKKLPNYDIVKIPMLIQGTSYNVVSSLVMLLQELYVRKGMMKVS